MSRKGKIIPIMLILLISMQICSSQTNYTSDNLAELVLKTNGGGVRPDYGLFIASYLRDIGIDVQVKVEEWTAFVGCLLQTHDYDMGIVGLSGGGASPDMYDVYGADGSLNLFGINKEMPYGNDSENMLLEGPTIMDLETRQQHYFDWQQLMMDRIVPMLPLFAPQSYVGTWSNLNGYDAKWGLLHSLPRMFFRGLHEGQESTEELQIWGNIPGELNPMLCDCGGDYFFESKLLNENLIVMSPGFEPTKNGLIRDWEQIDDFHFKFYMRDNVYWNPSYNVTERDEGSIPLNEIPISQLAKGLKNNEYSDGTNQQVTAKDAVFTILLWGNSALETGKYRWVSNVYVDTDDILAFHIYIDGDYHTPELEYHPDFWESLDWPVLPEFFLNSSEEIISYSYGGVKTVGLSWSMVHTPQWWMHSRSQFGCGKYMLDVYPCYPLKEGRAILQASPYWMGVDPIDESSEDLDIKRIYLNRLDSYSDILDEFLIGNLDWAGLRFNPDKIRMVEADSRFNVQGVPTAEFSFLFFNLQRPFLGGDYNYMYLTSSPDKEAYTYGIAVRKAICYAIDREEMNQIIHNGDYIIAHSVLYPFTGYFYYDDIIKYNYDLDVAKEWLSSGGYTCTTTTNIALSPIIIFVFVIFSLILRKRVKKRKIRDLTS